jgi:hypothetical protein
MEDQQSILTIQRPDREPDLILKGKDRYDVSVWIKESLFWIDNDEWKVNQCLKTIKSKTGKFEDVMSYLNYIASEDEEPRQKQVIDFLTELELLDDTIMHK